MKKKAAKRETLERKIRRVVEKFLMGYVDRRIQAALTRIAELEKMIALSGQPAPDVQPQTVTTRIEPDRKNIWAVVIDEYQKQNPGNWLKGKLWESFRVFEMKGFDVITESRQGIPHGCYILLDAPLPEIPANVWKTKSPKKWKSIIAEWKKDNKDLENFPCANGIGNCKTCLLDSHIWTTLRCFCPEPFLSSVPALLAVCDREIARRADRGLKGETADEKILRLNLWLSKNYPGEIGKEVSAIDTVIRLLAEKGHEEKATNDKKYSDKELEEMWADYKKEEP